MTAPTPAALDAEHPFPWSKVQHIPGTSVVNGGTLLLDANGAAMGLVVVIDCEKGDAVRPAITRALNTAGNVAKTLRMLDCSRREGAEALAQVATLTADRDQWRSAHTREYEARIATEMEQSAAVSARAAAEAALARATVVIALLKDEIDLSSQHRNLEFELDDCLPEEQASLEKQVRAVRRRIDAIAKKRTTLEQKT